MPPRPLSSDWPPPPAASELFGERLALAEQYAALLATTGIEHGLVGPGEGPRLWERHLLNCAVIAPALDPGSHVVDIGSGAGLPGVVLAIVRADLRLTLVEPLHRRTTWLRGTVADLGLDNVEVLTARAETLHGRLRARHVTARAVARLRLVAAWSLPLLEDGGSLLALKGQAAEAELAEDRHELRRLGAASALAETYGEGLLTPPTRVVRVTVDDSASSAPRRSQRRQRRSRHGNRGDRGDDTERRDDHPRRPL